MKLVRSTTSFLALVIAIFLGLSVHAQRQVRTRPAPPLAQRSEDIQIPDSQVQVISTYPISTTGFGWLNAPTAADPAAVYSNVGTFSGNLFSPGGQANAPAITRMMVDDTTFTSSPPYKIGRFSFSVCNANATANTFRPRVRFYLDDNSGAPGTVITGFSFNPLSVATNSCSTFFTAVAAPFTVTTQKMWAGMLFDNSGATSTAAEMNNYGQGIFQTPDAGSSADSFFLTTSAPPSGGSFLSSNPGPGSSTNFGGAPLANFGWEFRRAFTVGSINRAEPDTKKTGQNASWTLAFDTSTGATASVTGLTATNFSLTQSGGVSGATITNVVDNTGSYTITVNLGSGTGTVQLNMVNATNANTVQTNTFPVAGQAYTVTAPTAANVSVSGRVLDHSGAGLQSARVLITDANGTTHTTLTNAFGYYAFDGIASGQNVVVAAVAKGYSFTPRTVSLNDAVADLNFTPQ